MLLKKVFLFCAVSALMFAIAAQDLGVPARSTVGVGGRALALGNNYVALSDDVSAMFWNPAGMAFTPVREFQVALSGFSNNLETTFRENGLTGKKSANRQRVWPNIIGLLRSIPTTRGGLSVAFGFQSPYSTDDILSYDSITVDSTVAMDYYSFGQLNYLTGAFGLQVAPDFGIGASVSFMVGRNSMRLKRRCYTTSGILINEDFDKISQTYFGGDIRLGLLYSMIDRMKIGLRIVLPQYIVFNENWNVDEDTLVTTYEENGRLKTAVSGAFGISYRFPFILISSEVRTRSPIPDADDESYYARWKTGAGAGVEIPLFVKSFLLRVGYSWNEFDRYPMLIEYDNLNIDTDINVAVKKDEHLITTGFSIMTRHGLSFDLSYGYNFWEMDSSGGKVNEQHSAHRFIGSFAIRY